ncbi:uncharacterized protein KY384_001134 [Bacidia gigantensis]|uniref:uncharacterized protein n=1 Tax=Bacidia gigantensis TaxID=2732470 RepID=UPI001D059057|nr:uncharacterized protein KY384_001134 [Bacidia gigantensis]KAG8534290.1 hypothetical protein KY384_001134 [Bacidia gigantensis]
MNLEYRLDEVVWADFHGGAELSPKEHALTRSERYKIVKYRISKALIESSDNIPTSAETFEDEQKWQEMRTRIDWISQVLTDAKHEYDQDYQYRGPMEYYNPELGYMVGADGDYMVGEYGENAEWTGLDDLSESEDSAWESDNSASELNDPAFEEHVDHPPSSPESEYFIDPSAIQWLGDTEMADPTTPTETSGPEVNEIPVPMEVDNGFSEAEDEAWIYTTDGRR